MFKLRRILQKTLPAPILDELLTTGKIAPKKHKNISIMFLDIVNFTQVTENEAPENLVRVLDRYYSTYDRILEKFEVRKIKSIGDSYMCVSGLLDSRYEHAVLITLASLEIQEWMKNKKAELISMQDTFMEIRVGIHTGEAVSGVVGVDNYAFDVWGQSVNKAHRMEENCPEEKVNVSGDTWAFLWPYFDGEYRGKIPAKNMGAIDMYVVNGIKQEFADKIDIKKENSFWKRVRIHSKYKEKYEELERDVLQKMREKLSTDLSYHSLDHTLEVLTNVDVLVENLEQEISDHHYLLLRTAALFHDFGYTVDIDHHEQRSAEICKEWLPKYNYSESDIELIAKTILATSLNVSVNNILEEILVDADLFYLGTSNYKSRANDYRKELGALDQHFEEDDWKSFQLKFLKSHKFYTNYGKLVLEPKKQEVILALEN